MKHINDIPLPPDHDSWRFVKDLQEPSDFHIRWESKFHTGKGELDLSKGVAPSFEFSDPEGVLETANADLIKFFKFACIYRPRGIPVIISKCDTAIFTVPESFRLEVTEKGIRLLSGDTEGVRRGIYHLEEMLLSSQGPFLPIGITERKSWLRNRISRCFFGPIKRPPLNRDELMDDVDYYPEAYLNRLAHEGINGLWLTIEFRDLCRTSLTEAPSNVEKRLDKLRRTVDKCLRYGIKTWVFCIEPASFKPDDPLLKKYPELRGASDGGGGYCFCPGSDIADRYLYESTHWLFSQVPGLGGLINISYGERSTTCLSSIHGDSDDPVDCPRCGRIPRWQILHRSLGAMQRGMREANPDAELISWFYMPHANTHPDWMFEMAGHMPEGVVLQYNFESGALKTQAGKLRCGGEIDSVTCMTKTIPERMEGEFMGMLLAKMKSGALAELSINWWTRSNAGANSLWYEMVQVCGTKGEAYRMSGKGTFIKIHDSNNKAVIAKYGEEVLQNFVKVPHTDTQGHLGCIDEWLKSLRHEKTDIRTSGRECRGTVEVAEAAYLSEQQGKTIKLPISPKPWVDSSGPKIVKSHCSAEMDGVGVRDEINPDNPLSKETKR